MFNSHGILYLVSDSGDIIWKKEIPNYEMDYYNPGIPMISYGDGVVLFNYLLESGNVLLCNEKGEFTKQSGIIAEIIGMEHNIDSVKTNGYTFVYAPEWSEYSTMIDESGNIKSISNFDYTLNWLKYNNEIYNYNNENLNVKYAEDDYELVEQINNLEYIFSNEIAFTSRIEEENNYINYYIDTYTFNLENKQWSLSNEKFIASIDNTINNFYASEYYTRLIGNGNKLYLFTPNLDLDNGMGNVQEADVRYFTIDSNYELIDENSFKIQCNNSGGSNERHSDNIKRLNHNYVYYDGTIVNLNTGNAFNY